MVLILIIIKNFKNIKLINLGLKCILVVIELFIRYEGQRVGTRITWYIIREINYLKAFIYT